VPNASSDTCLTDACGQTKDGPKRKSRAEPLPVPSISLPKVGGAIRGMDEKFAAHHLTGIGSMTAQNRGTFPNLVWVLPRTELRSSDILSPVDRRGILSMDGRRKEVPG
jgi:hypothetical protein